ncbi:MAG: putative hydro-lyase [Minwuia sp.]|uniref:putative hydro-lyase n=1 Tax=Minwuia sp. TaxID=2493630 RepID=UPI003A8572CF
MAVALTHDDLKACDVAGVRRAIRSGSYTGHTAGLVPGRLQANLAILSADLAGPFREFCELNPKPCPLVGVTAPGDPAWSALGDIDIRSDVPAYYIYENGERTGEVTDIAALWREDLVAFALGCSFTFENALIEAGIPMHHIDADRTVPMYRTSIETHSAGPFGGGTVVSMRYVDPGRVDEAVEISAAYPWAHGDPIHVGDPGAIGIRDIERPDWGDPPCGPAGVPVFWACGVTPQNALTVARPDFCITHKPGCMLITDIGERENAFVDQPPAHEQGD